MSHQSIREVLEQPFGPYLESELLSPECKFTNDLPLVLNDLELILDSKVSGLDYTESLKTDRDVKFLGVLEISSPSWLSERGKEILQRDMFKRRRYLNLDGLYRHRPANGFVVKVVVLGEKHVNVVYLGSKLIPNALVLNSHFRRDNKPDGRHFKVESMAEFTWQKSRTYLRRWRFYHLISQLSQHSSEPLPTCEWLMMKYKHINHIENAFVENHEVVSMFYSHVHWMLDQQRLTKRKFIDVPSWEEFRDSPTIHYNVDLDVKMTDAKTSRLTRSAKKSQPLFFRTQSSSPEPKPRLKTPDEEVLVGDSESEVESTLSSPERSPSPLPPMATDIRIRVVIPSSFYEEPPVPMDFIWRCEVRMCGCTIDLRDPSKDIIKSLKPDDVEFLTSLKWSLADVRLQDLFQSMVHTHRLDHLSSWNIGFRETGTPMFYWLQTPPNRKSVHAAWDALKESWN